MENRNVSISEFKSSYDSFLNTGKYNHETAVSNAYRATTSYWKHSDGSDVGQHVNEKDFVTTWIAEKARQWIESALFAPIVAILYIIGLFCMMFVTMAGYFLDSMLSPTLYNFVNEEIIIKGWTAVRDVCNLFFLLILLFIAFCTILQIEKYHAKKILLTFILMALLINFSKPIAIFIFDGSQLLMNFFLIKLKGDNASFSASLAGTSNIANILWNDESLNWSGNDKNTASQLAVKYLFADIFLFMLGMAYIVMAIYLLIRIIAIWILIILSPFAFLFDAVPDFKKLYSDWWSALFKYCYVGPAIAFFLWLSTFLEKTALSQSLNKQKTMEGVAATSNDTFLTWVVQFIIPFFVVLVFLYASIIIADKFGIQFAGAITSRANRWMGRAAKLGGAGLLAAGTLGQYRRVKDTYQGIKSGISQRPGWRVLTKEGRETVSKKRREDWEEKVAPFDISRERKKANDNKNASQGKVDTGVERGEAWALLLASKRGSLTADQLRSQAVQNIIQKSPELRKELLGNLRDKGDLHLAALLRSLTANENNDDRDKQTWSLSQFGRDEIDNNKNLGNIDWEKFASFDVDFERALADRLNNMAEVNPRGLSNTLSSGKNINFILNNPDFHQIVTRAQESSRKSYRENEERREQPSERPRIETVAYPRPRKTFRYDENGKLIE